MVKARKAQVFLFVQGGVRDTSGASEIKKISLDATRRKEWDLVVLVEKGNQGPKNDLKLDGRSALRYKTFFLRHTSEGFSK